MTVYYPSIPQPTDNPSVSQAQLLQNFGQINTSFSVNHDALTDATSANWGKHTFVSLMQQAVEPTTIASEGALYTYSVTPTGGSAAPQLFWGPESDGATVQLTNYFAPLNAATGGTFLPGGLIMQWAVVNCTASSVTAVTFPTAFSAAAFCVQVTGWQTASSNSVIFVVNASVTKTGFSIKNQSGSAQNVSWLAIGPS